MAPAIFSITSTEQLNETNCLDPKSPLFPIQYQKVLLLHGLRQRYILTPGYQVPAIRSDDEMLVKVQTISLNPIDWKSADFGFGLPTLPCISGRDFAGTMVMPPRAKSRFRSADVVVAISTDYRDFRKSGFQEYSITTSFNAFRLPPTMPAKIGSSVGVAFVAAALGLGICLGLDFSRTGKCGSAASVKGPDIFELVRRLDPESLPRDIRDECLNGISSSERPNPDDWLAIWGASSTTGLMALQLAKRAGLRVICIADVTKHGKRLRRCGADVLIDRFDPDMDMAASKIVAATGGRALRYGLDTVGWQTAEILQEALASSSRSFAASAALRVGHLVALSGFPKRGQSECVRSHSVPIKLFHEAPAVGKSLMVWIEQLLTAGELIMPDVLDVAGGLEGINHALDLMRSGRVSGARLSVSLD